MCKQIADIDKQNCIFINSKNNSIPDKHNIANHTLERQQVEDSNRPNGIRHYTFRTLPYHPKHLEKKII